MDWPAPRQDDHTIETNRESRKASLSRKKQITGTRQSRLLRFGHCLGGGQLIAARLDLDEGEGIAARGDQVNFALMRFVSCGDDAVTF